MKRGLAKSRENFPVAVENVEPPPDRADAHDGLVVRHYWRAGAKFARTPRWNARR
jgi:hypothetical protein